MRDLDRKAGEASVIELGKFGFNRQGGYSTLLSPATIWLTFLVFRSLFATLMLLASIVSATAQTLSLRDEGLIEGDLGSPSLTGVPIGTLPASGEGEVPRFRKSFFQGAEILGGYLADLGDTAGGLDLTFEEARLNFGVPLGSLDNLLGVRPFFRTTHLNGPDVIDVPETLFDTGVALFHRKTWTAQMSTTAIVSPTVRSDFTTDQNALRVFGLGLVHWQCRPTLRLSAGVLYLDREDVGVLPAIGLLWTPTPTWRLDGTLPQPRISRRVFKDGARSEAWASIGGSFGGNSWAVTRDSNETDQLTLRDFRLFVDYELIRAGNRGMLIAAGYAFGRTLEYESGGFEIDLDDAFFVEANWRF